MQFMGEPLVLKSGGARPCEQNLDKEGPQEHLLSLGDRLLLRSPFPPLPIKICLTSKRRNGCRPPPPGRGHVFRVLEAHFLQTRMLLVPQPQGTLGEQHGYM